MRHRKHFLELRGCPVVDGRLHPPADPTGQTCEHCTAARAEARARCAVTHSERSATYPDVEGVERFHCCYQRVDGMPE